MTYEPENAHGAARLTTLGGRLRAVRLAKGLTGDEVAEKLGISRPTFTTWELDKVQTVDEAKIKRFAKLTGVAAQWLLHATGAAPKLNLGVHDRAFVGKSKDTIAAMTPVSAPEAPLTEVAEIKPALKAHAKGLDTAPQATWAIPREVLALGFNCEPDQVVIKRARHSYTMADGTMVARGDYVLIDASRNVIDEPGLYYVADPDGLEAKRAFATIDEPSGDLVVRMHGGPDPVNPGELEVLGRAMGLFRAI